MRCVSATILFAYVEHNYAQADQKGLMDRVEQLFNRALTDLRLTGMSTPLHHESLDSAILGKPGHVAVPLQPCRLHLPCLSNRFRGPSQQTVRQRMVKSAEAESVGSEQETKEASRRVVLGTSLAAASIPTSQANAIGMNALQMASKTCTGSQPHTRSLFENQRLSIDEFLLPPGGETTVCARYPTVRWQVDPARHSLQVDNAEAVEAKVFDKQVFWVEPGSTWRLKNIGKETYRQMIFEIKEPPKYSEAEVRSRFSRAKYSTNVGTELLFENKLCRIWDFNLPPLAKGPTHHHTLDYAFVYVAPGRLLGYYPDGRPGLFDDACDNDEVRWFDIPDSAPEDDKYAHGGKNGYDMPQREYLIELK